MQVFRTTVLTIASAWLLSTTVLAHPGSGIAVDRNGSVYFLDTGSGLWKVDARGRITRLPGQRFHWLAIDANDRFATARLPSGVGGDIERSGARPTILLSSDYPILVGQDGNLYYAASGSGALRMMRRTPGGSTSTLATLPAAAGGARQWINGIAAGPEGSIYYTEDRAVRRISAKGVISIVATVSALASGPRIPGNDVRPYLRGLAVDSRGTVFVASSEDGRVLKIVPGGKVTTILQTQSPWSPTAVAVHGSDVYVLEYLHTPGDNRLEWLPRVRKIPPGGKSTIIATVSQMPGARRQSVASGR